jgi:hypothetical protein
MSESNVQSSINATRAKLEGTLGAIEEKLDVKRQAGVLVERTKSSYEANPIPWIIGATAAAIVAAGLVAWAIFGGDDD